MRSFILLPLLAILFYSCQPSAIEVKEYNGKIIAEEEAVLNKENTLRDLMSDYEKVNEMKAAHQDLLKQINLSIENVTKMKDFYGDTTFAGEALKLLYIYKSVGENEYSKLVTLYQKSDEEFTEADATLDDQLTDAIDDKLDNQLEQFDNAQKAFAKKYKVEIEGTK